jgi:RimJ/RimL family protein N-acetyltransferase
MTVPVRLRHVEQADLEAFFEQQLDPVAIEMAAFPPRDLAAFTVHWGKILADPNVMARTILEESAVAGHVVCWEAEGKRLIGYWLGRRFWGRGIASRALAIFVASVSVRPLYAHVAKNNVASMRVLEKCGFERTGENQCANPTGGQAVEEYMYCLR